MFRVIYVIPRIGGRFLDTPIMFHETLPFLWQAEYFQHFLCFCLSHTFAFKLEHDISSHVTCYTVHLHCTYTCVMPTRGIFCSFRIVGLHSGHPGLLTLVSLCVGSKNNIWVHNFIIIIDNNMSNMSLYFHTLTIPVNVHASVGPKWLHISQYRCLLPVLTMTNRRTHITAILASIITCQLNTGLLLELFHWLGHNMT